MRFTRNHKTSLTREYLYPLYIVPTPGPCIMRFLGLGKSLINWISHYVNIHVLQIYSNSAILFTYQISYMWIFARYIIFSLALVESIHTKWIRIVHYGVFVYEKILSKGQIISKCFFVSSISSNKSTWGIIVVKSNSFVRLLEEIEDIKNPFEIIWPLTMNNSPDK